MLQEKVESAGVYAARMDRRYFMQTAAMATLGSLLPRTEAAHAGRDDRDLAARIQAFRSLDYYPSIDKYAEALKLDPVIVASDISDFLRRPEIVEYIKKVANKYAIPSYLLAAIVAEERTSTGIFSPIKNWFHRKFEDLKSEYGWDTSIGIANVKMSIGAHYLFGIKPSKEEFNKLTKGKKQQVVSYLEDWRNNLDIAARFLGHLKKKFLEWNAAYIKSSQLITEEEVDANPLALLRLANGYSSGEDRLDRPVNEKAKRVISVMVNNPFIMELYDGKKYKEKYNKLKTEKETRILYTPQLNKVRELLESGIDSMHEKRFYTGYALLNDAAETARKYALFADSREWIIRFLAYATYSHAEAGFILRKATEHKIRVFRDNKSDPPFYANNAIARSQYRNALDIYNRLEGERVKIEELKVEPKKGWEKRLPSKNDIEKVLTTIENEMYSFGSRRTKK